MRTGEDLSEPGSAMKSWRIRTEWEPRVQGKKRLERVAAVRRQGQDFSNFAVHTDCLGTFFHCRLIHCTWDSRLIHSSWDSAFPTSSQPCWRCSAWNHTLCSNSAGPGWAKFFCRERERRQNLDFVGHTVSAVPIPLCHCDVKAAIENR